MLNLPTTEADIDQLIKDQIQEDLHLDYKESPAVDRSKRQEIGKDVSAFANSDGGILIYGVVESNNLPVSKDGGVDHTKYSREWLEQVISSNVTPRIDGIRISPIQVSVDRSYYAVEVQKSFRGPHQNSDKKYYKRFNFQSVPMEDYEINDVRNRQKNVQPLVSVDVELDDGLFANLVVSNIGHLTAQDITFVLSDELQSWLSENEPNLFTRGIKYLPPGKIHKFMFESVNAALAEDCPVPSSFSISVSYRHPEADQFVTEVFNIDFEDYRNTLVTHSEVYQQGKSLKEAVDKLTGEVKELNKHVKNISAVSGDTGLDLSITTLRNLQHLINGDGQIEKINPFFRNYQLFMEVLGVDSSMALRLRSFFWRRDEKKNLREVEGMTEDLIEKIKRFFILGDNVQV